MKSDRTRLRTPLGLFVITAVALMSTVPVYADVEGIWLDKDGGTVRIRNCGGGVCGNIVGVNPRIDPATGLPWTDKKNADPRWRNRPLVGVPVLIGMRQVEAGKWTGQLYNVDDGKTYKGNLIEISRDAIRIEGCWLGVCGGENLTRVKSTASSR